SKPSSDRLGRDLVRHVPSDLRSVGRQGQPEREHHPAGRRTEHPRCDRRVAAVWPPERRVATRELEPRRHAERPKRHGRGKHGRDPVDTHGPLGEPLRDRDARFSDLLRERRLGLRRLDLGRRRERPSRLLDRLSCLVSDLARVVPIERVVVFEDQDDVPEGVVVAQPERVAYPVQSPTLDFRGLTAEHLREGLLDCRTRRHGSTPNSGARALRTSARHRLSSARLPMGRIRAAFAADRYWVNRSSATRSARSGNVTERPPRASTSSRRTFDALYSSNCESSPKWPLRTTWTSECGIAAANSLSNSKLSRCRLIIHSTTSFRPSSSSIPSSVRP